MNIYDQCDECYHISLQRILSDHVRQTPRPRQEREGTLGEIQVGNTDQIIQAERKENGDNDKKKNDDIISSAPNIETWSNVLLLLILPTSYSGY